MFTFSFNTAFAATEYTLEDYANALTAEKTAQENYLASRKAEALGLYKFNADGFTEDNELKYSLKALEAVADEIIEEYKVAMTKAIDDVLNDKDWPKTDAPDKTVVSNIVVIKNATDFKNAIDAKTTELNKYQAPLSKEFVEGKLNVDLSKYNSTDKKYENNTLTAVQAVEKAIGTAKEALAKASKASTDAAKIEGYKAAYNTFKADMSAIKTIADEEFSDQITGGDVNAAVNAFAKSALEKIAAKFPVAANMAYDAVLDWDDEVKADEYKVFWEADKNVATKGELFGVAIANIKKVTRTEAAAVVSAYTAAVENAKAPLKAFANGDKNAFNNYTSEADCMKLISNAMKAAKKYEDVVAAGEKMKKDYVYGVKVYNDAAVDAAVKAAEKLVYADLATGLKENAVDYIKAAAAKENITLEESNYELQKFLKAIEDAAKKMFSDGTNAKTPALKVSYGDDKTSEADLVYLKGTYDPTEAGTKWDSIAKATVDELKDAQSYDEIKDIMAKAAEKFAKLLKADDAADVKAARISYKKALGEYGTLKKTLLDDEKYPDTNVDAAVLQGEILIDKAVTLDGVKAAYEDAKRVIDSIKTADELKALKEEVEKKINALSYTAKLTVADKAVVKEAYDAYKAYRLSAGAEEITAAKALLQTKYDRVNELEAKAIEEKAKAINDKLDKLGMDENRMSDADVAAKVALKAEADAVKAEAKALVNEIDSVNDDFSKFLAPVSMSEVDDLKNVDFSSAVAKDVEIKLVKANKAGATVLSMKEALAAYEKLTDRQKYALDADALPLIKVLQQKLVAAVESLKLSTYSKYNNKGITVKWVIKAGSKNAADGYQVWRSTKSNKGYKKLITVKGYGVKNTKNLKKGTTYYYKVRAYKRVDGKLYFSDWSNKAYRKAR